MFIVYQLGTIRFEKRKMHSSIEISVDLVKLNWKGGTNKRGAVFVHIDMRKQRLQNILFVVSSEAYNGVSRDLPLKESVASLNILKNGRKGKRICERGMGTPLLNEAERFWNGYT